VQKNTPHIMFAGGLIGVVTSTVLACRATLKVDDMFTEMKEDTDAAKSMGDQKDLAYAYLRNGVRFTKEYAPALIVGGVSVALLTGSHVQLTRRNAALTAAYAGLHQAYMDYRSRVRDEVGEDKERDLFHGISLEEAKNEAGKIAKRKVADPNKLSIYARFFDEGSPNWQKNSEFNRLFVQCQQNYANDILQARGHLFLNEVYDMLGINRSSAGQIVGWVINGEGDNFVDFGMFEAWNADFINGHEPSILLEFNVDGVVLDKI
jgi:hypothetical protein